MSRRAVVASFVREARDRQVQFLAAAVAYYAFVSLVPLALLAVAVGTALGGERLAAAAATAAGGLLTPTGQALLRDALVAPTGRGPATAAGLVVLLWSGLRLFRGLDTAFSQVYGVDTPEPLPRQLLDAGIVLAAVAGAAAVVVVVGGVVPALGVLAVPWLPLFAGLVGAFLPVYYVFPDTVVTVHEALPGAVFAAAGWTALTEGFRLYVGVAGGAELYGVLGGVLLLVTWFYAAGTVIILGAVLNAVLAGVDDGDAADADAGGADADAGGADADGPAPDIVALDREVRGLRRRLEERTVDREELEADLRGYVRARVRRGHARGWGPYLVLLYGTAMTLGAFYLLSGGWAILAMVVVWLSTLGLYALMVVVGAAANAAD
ncbi:MAG: YihY/virulence factor BrkB family protein, partial [Halobacteriaceae archaeon]